MITEEEFNWQQKMWVERTEKFEPPMYEQIGKEMYYRFAEKNHKCRGTLAVTTTNIRVWSGYVGYCEKEKSFGDVTKEHYLEAVEYAKKLFLGDDHDTGSCYYIDENGNCAPIEEQNHEKGSEG